MTSAPTATSMRPTRPAPLVRARAGVSALFLLYGVILGTWTSRIPAVKQQLGLTDGQLSIGLLAFAAGAIVGMQLSGRLVDRLGSTAVLMPAVFADAVALIAPAYAADLAMLAAFLFVFGAVHGVLNVAMNVNAVEVQRAWGRPIISSCHAVYSIGGFVGAAIGGLFAAAAWSAATTFEAVAVAGWATAACVIRWVASPPHDALDAGASGPPDTDQQAGRGNLRAVAFLGVLAFCCLVGEGAAADWSAVYLRDSLLVSGGFAASGYAAFSVMMTLGRLVGDRLVGRFGAVRVVRACGLLAAVGFSTALLVGRPVAGVIGFGCLGAGLSCTAPQVFAAAGNRDPARAGNAIGRVASLGFLGFIVGPAVIGSTAQAVGLPRALGIPAALAFFVALAAPALRPRMVRATGFAVTS